MCNFQCKIINQHTIALQNTFCKWLWYETKSIVHFTKKGQSTPRLFVFNYQYTNKQSWIRWHSAIMYRYSCPHIYTQIEKTNPIFKTWFVQLKISTGIDCELFITNNVVVLHFALFEWLIWLMRQNDHKNGTPSKARRPRLITKMFF
mgnify:CR=1 FL=1